MYPHERSLVKQLAGKPFAIVGVNNDFDRDVLKEVLVKKKITWRNFWDGEDKGEIGAAWNISSWPTTFVLDSKGIIRFKDLRGEELDRAIQLLLAEMEISVTIDPDHLKIGGLNDEKTDR